MVDSPNLFELKELIARAGFEAVLIATAMWLIFIRLGVAQELKHLGRGRRMGILGFLLVWTTVQVLDRWQYFYPQPISFYPMARFAMYQVGQPAHVVESYRVDATYPDGTVSEVNLTAVFKSIGLPSLHTRMRTIHANLRSVDPARVEEAEAEIQGYADGFRRLLEARGEESPLKVTFTGLSYQVDDQALVRDSVLWTRSYEVEGR